MPEPQALMLRGRAAQPSSWTARALLEILFRRKRVFALTFCAVTAAVLIAVLVLPVEYEAQTKMLIERRRFDPIITSTDARQGSGADMSELSRLDEQDIDSEIDLLNSDDVLRQVVERCGLAGRTSAWRQWLLFGQPSPEVRMAKAVETLRKHLRIDPPNKSNIVTVGYRSPDPAKAADVLRVLTQVYIQKHLDVHRPAGSTEFFAAEVVRKRKALDDAQERLADFTRREGVVSAPAESSALMEKASAFDGTLHSTRAQIAAVEQRIANLRAQLRHASPRVVTQVKTSSTLLEKLKDDLYSLQLKRSELLTKYQPTYRLVQDVDKQIADTRSAIADAERNLTAEQTTDQDPVYAWLKSQLAQASSELSALRATEADTHRTVDEYRNRAVALQTVGNEQNDLQLAVKTAEDAYLEAVRQQNDAHLSAALDRAQIANVAVAEAATVPALPLMPWTVRLTLGLALALFLATAAAFVADYIDPSFRSPLDVESTLAVPVLAAIPRGNVLPNPPPYSLEA